MPQDHKVGKLGYAKIQAAGGTITIVHIDEWGFNPTGGTEETTNTGTAGFETHEPTTKGATLTFGASWDANAMPHDTAPVFDVGDKITVELYIDDPADDVKFEIPTVIVTSLPVVSNVKGKVSWTCEGRVSGSWTNPTAGEE